MAEFKYCTSCLVTDVKMFNLAEKHTSNASSTLGDIFSRLLQVPTFDKRHHVCYECTRLIHKFQEFKSKCQKAQSLLSPVVDFDKPEAMKVIILNIDRTFHKLSSSLTISSVKVTESVSDEIESDFKIIEVKPKLELDLKNIKNTDNKELNNSIHNEDSMNLLNTNKVEYDVSEEFLYSEKSHHSNNIVTTKLYNNTPKEKKPTIRKRKTKAVDIDKEFGDDEPLSKILKRYKDNEIAKNVYPKNFNMSFFQDFATVIFLTPEDAKRELLLRKESANYKMCRYKCEFCYKGYEAKTAYENHMKRHNAKYGEYECDLCHLRFPEQKFLNKHSLSCHKRKFVCKLCPYVCNCTHQAKTHVSLHKGKKYPCKECKEVFSMPNSLLMHKRIKHVTECVCELCGSTFATPRGLFSHNIKLHRQDVNMKQGPKCDECDIHFATEMAWKKHLVLSSKHKVSNGCKHCGETFPNMEELKSHLKIHARKQSSALNQLKLPAVCSLCDKWLSDRNEYKSHMMSQHPESDVAMKLSLENTSLFVCEICGQMFKKQCSLTYHQRKHTGERPYSCVQCGKSFAAGGALTSHGAVHARARPLACRLCGRRFTHRSALNKHMKVHLGIRPHKCTTCGKGFISPCDRKLHIKCVHNKVPWPKRDRTKKKNTEGTVQLN